MAKRKTDEIVEAAPPIEVAGTAPASVPAVPVPSAVETAAEAVTPEMAAAKVEAAGKRKKKRMLKKIVTVAASRKESIARATVKPGKSVFRYNKVHFDAIENPYVREIVMEPIKIADEFATNIDIEINAVGGGVFSQAQAARTAIARSLVAYTKDISLKQRFLQYDRYLLVEDSRRVEPKKYLGRKARARFQKSYR